MDSIVPELAGGFRDYLPKEMIPRQKMLEKIKEVFERFGFVPLDTPGIEKTDVLLGGEKESDKMLFRVRKATRSEEGMEDVGKDDLSLRFDLTVPLARVVAQYPNEIKKPFKRYQFGRVWRGERQQAGRFREFTQLDADIVGSADLLADAEIVALMDATMRAVGFGDGSFLIRVSNRKVLNGLAVYAGFPETLTPTVLRAIDKLGKSEWDAVAAELAGAVQLPTGAIEKLRTFVEVCQAPTFVLDDARRLLASSPQAEEGIRELAEIAACLNAFGVPPDAWKIDLSVARGLGYYTGTVFETTLTALPNIGSVISGGRYDGLVARFGAQPVPATGTSVGVDRLFVAMRELGMIIEQSLTAKVIVLNFAPEARKVCAKVTGELRRVGIATDLYLGNEGNFKGQLAYAVAQEYLIVVIIGKDEVARQVAQVKDLARRTQEEVPLELVEGAVERLIGV
ncbi:MAG: histidine--tRNA ligase [bacterium]|nr:histidine--tRNA ligase [bacterium]